MQGIVAKDDNQKIYFLGLGKKAYPIDGGGLDVDEEWEINIIKEMPDHYIVEPIKKLSKQISFQIEGSTPVGAADRVIKVVSVGERLVGRELVGLVRSTGDCYDMPPAVRSELLQRRAAWGDKKEQVKSQIRWPDPGYAEAVDHAGIRGLAITKITRRKARSYFVGSGCAIKGPVKNAFQEEDAMIGRMLLQGGRLKVSFGMDKDGFLQSFFQKARLRCGNIKVPFPEGIYRRHDLIQYFVAKAATCSTEAFSQSGNTQVFPAEASPCRIKKEGYR